MPSNFDFLTGEFRLFREDAAEAERHALTAPRSCAFYARRALEKTVNWLYARDPGLKMPYQDNLAALIHWVTEPVIPAWIAGTQEPRMARLNYIPVFWISAIHAEMTV